MKVFKAQEESLLKPTDQEITTDPALLLATSKNLRLPVLPLIVTGTAITGLCLAILALLNASRELPPPSIASPTILLIAAALQQALYVMTAYAWKLYLYHNAGVSLTLWESYSHSTVTGLGKYIPGKVWGIMLRGMLASRLHLTADQSTALSLHEQLFVLAVGALTGLLLVSSLPYSAALIMLIPLALYLPYRFTLSHMKGIAALISKNKNLNVQLNARINLGGFMALSLVYLLLWILTVAVLLTLALTYTSPDLSTAMKLAGSMMLAVCTGFVILFLPGGIGAREATFGAMAGIWIGPSNALSIILMHRALVTCSDIVAGMVGFLIMQRTRVRR